MIVEGIERAIAEYQKYKDRLPEIMGEEAIITAYLAESSLPSLLMEKGFYEGNSDIIKAVLKASPEHVMGRKFLAYFPRIEDGEIFLGSINVEKSEPYHDWQLWRLGGIETGHYKRENFSLYDDLTLHLESVDEITLHSNKWVELQGEYLIQFGSFTDIETIIYSVVENPDSEDFRYEYRGMLTTPLTGDEYYEAIKEQFNLSGS